MDTDSRVVAKFGENRSLGSLQNVISFRRENSYVGLFQAPILPSLCRSHPKFPERCRPWSVHVCQIWSGLVAVCRSYSRKTDFSDPPSDYNVGWKQPTINVICNRSFKLMAYCCCGLLMSIIQELLSHCTSGRPLNPPLYKHVEYQECIVILKQTSTVA